MPLVSDGDVMKHTPSINDTTSSARFLAAGGRGLDTAWSYDHGNTAAAMHPWLLRRRGNRACDACYCS
jgi:aryl-alcohol dehydrogenase-like predicted oxidoreductase